MRAVKSFMGSYSMSDSGVFLSELSDKQPQSTIPNILHPSFSITKVMQKHRRAGFLQLERLQRLR